MIYNDKVKEFMVAFGQEVKFEPEWPEPELMKLRRKLIREEYYEFIEAKDENDIVDMAGELCDILYVVYGTGLAFGVDVDAYFDKITNNPLVNLSDRRMSEVDPVLLDGIYKWWDTFENIGFTLAAIVRGVIAEAVWQKIPIEACFNEVHASNMSKLGDDGKPIYREDGKVLKGKNYKKHDLRSIIFPPAA